MTQPTTPKPEDGRLGASTEDDSLVSKVEISFAIPVFITQEQQSALAQVIDTITSRECNIPENGVHWLFGTGGKPRWSQCDARLLQQPTTADAPEEGEPTFDDSILWFETSARDFVSDKERDDNRARRAKRAKKIPTPDGYLTWLDAALNLPMHTLPFEDVDNTQNHARRELDKLRAELREARAARHNLQKALDATTEALDKLSQHTIGPALASNMGEAAQNELSLRVELAEKAMARVTEILPLKGDGNDANVTKS